MFGRKKLPQRQPLSESEVDVSSGLSEEQIRERIEKGHVNNIKIGTSKTVLGIIVSNTCTFINLLCVLIFAWIVTVSKSFQDLVNCSFMVIILINTGIGIFQEIRAKHMIDKMSLLSSPKVSVMRRGAEEKIEVNEILRDDVMLLSTGNQVSSDCVILEGSVEVNESMLTGESRAVKRGAGEQLLSGSFIVTGSCRARVTQIAEENYIQRLATEAKQFKRQPSELLRSLNKIIKVLSIIIVIFAVPAFANNMSANLGNSGGGFWAPLFHLGSYTGQQLYAAYKLSVMHTSAALIGMIPAGLFLLASVALYVGVIRLAKHHALVQGLYSIETLARVNVLCLDKTGTITDGTMKVTDVVPLKDADAEYVTDVIASMQRVLTDNNQTSVALKAYFGTEGSLEEVAFLPFSSDRKCSAVEFEGGKVYLLGAPEYVCGKLAKSVAAMVNGYAEEGKRCLLLASGTGSLAGDDPKLPAKTVPVAVIAIEDNIKSEAADTIRYFKENGVDVKVISGDNPVTVSQVAKRVGIEHAEDYISLQGLSDDEVRAAATKYSVFGRVNPAQKKLLVQTLKAAGNTVAMTGDGINDILALKEADCSIAMANGCEATRNVAQLVLMDSNFASMPRVVGEGRRVINNITRAATLFLMKSVFSLVLQFILIFWQKSFPIFPQQLSFINLLAIGIPSFFLALEPNNERIKGNFIYNVFKKVLPAALTMVIDVVLVMMFADPDYLAQISLSDNQQSTFIMVIMFSVYMLVLWDICKPFNRGRYILFWGIVTVASVIVLASPQLPVNSIFNLFKIANLWRFNIMTFLFSLVAFSFFAIILTRKLLNKVEELIYLSIEQSKKLGENIKNGFRRFGK